MRLSVNYRQYALSRRQYAASAAAGCLAAFLAAWLFYRSVPAALVLAGAGLACPRLYRASLLNGRRERLRRQFKEALFSLASSLAAGRSVENAFAAVIGDLALVYPDPRTEILGEFRLVLRRMENGEPFETALRRFSERTGIEEIEQFTDVISIAKRSGGDIVEIVRRTSAAIGEKLEVQQEIAVMVAQKRFEARIMMAVPFAFMAFLTLAAPDYMAPLYQGAGYLLLTGALALLAGCCWLINRIMSISF